MLVKYYMLTLEVVFGQVDADSISGFTVFGRHYADAFVGFVLDVSEPVGHRHLRGEDTDRH